MDLCTELTRFPFLVGQTTNSISQRDIDIVNDLPGLQLGDKYLVDRKLRLKDDISHGRKKVSPTIRTTEMRTSLF